MRGSLTLSRSDSGNLYSTQSYILFTLYGRTFEAHTRVVMVYITQSYIWILSLCTRIYVYGCIYGIIYTYTCVHIHWSFHVPIGTRTHTATYINIWGMHAIHAYTYYMHIYTYIHTYIYVYIYICTYTSGHWLYREILAWKFHIPTGMRTHGPIYRNTYICTCMNSYIRAHTHVYIYIYIYIYAHKHIYYYIYTSGCWLHSTGSCRPARSGLYR